MESKWVQDTLYQQSNMHEMMEEIKWRDIEKRRKERKESIGKRCAKVIMSI